MYAIETKNISKKLEGFSLKDISLKVPTGTTVGLIGENGAGKTTLIKLIINLMSPDSGEVILLGENNAKANRAIYKDVGILLDDYYLPEELNLQKMDTIMSSIYKNWNAPYFWDFVNKFELPTEKKFEHFSTGMRIKAALAITLSHNSRLLILDEPTTGLDPIVREEILDLFLDHLQNEDHSILISSHITTDLEKIADYIAYIDNGRLLFVEPKDNLIYNYAIIKCSNEDMLKIPPEEIVRVIETSNMCKILVTNKAEAKQKYADLVVDDTSIDEIMLFFKKGRKSKC